MSRTLMGAAALVAGMAAAAALLPALGGSWVALFAHGMAGRPGDAASLVAEAEAVAALTLLPTLASALVAALLAGALQGLAIPREASRVHPGDPPADRRGARRPSLAWAAALLALTTALVVVAARLERPRLAEALHGDARTMLASAGEIAARLGLRVGVGLLAVGLAEHALLRLSLRAWLASRTRRRGSDQEALDPRVLAELRRRQRDDG